MRKLAQAVRILAQGASCQGCESGTDIDIPAPNDLKTRDMDKYVCIICGYIYDPAEGDPESGIAQGTAFEDIPEDWTCPACGVGKEHFEKWNG